MYTFPPASCAEGKGRCLTLALLFLFWTSSLSLTAATNGGSAQTGRAFTRVTSCIRRSSRSGTNSGLDIVVMTRWVAKPRRRLMAYRAPPGTKWLKARRNGMMSDPSTKAVKMLQASCTGSTGSADAAGAHPRACVGRVERRGRSSVRGQCRDVIPQTKCPQGLSEDQDRGP